MLIENIRNQCGGNRPFVNILPDPIYVPPGLIQSKLLAVPGGKVNEKKPMESSTRRAYLRVWGRALPAVSGRKKVAIAPAREQRPKMTVGRTGETLER